MLAFDLTPTRSTSEELKRLSTLDVSVYERLEQELNAVEISQTLPAVVTDAIERVVIDEELADLVEKHAMSMATLCRRRRSPAADVVDSMVAGCLDLGWDDEDVADWSRIASAFAKVIESTAVETVEKAISLYYDYDKLWLSASLLTDMRPIFDTQRANVLAGVITHTLKIEYRDEDARSKEFSIALDQDDILSLMRSCEEASSKQDAAVAIFEDSTSSTPVIRLGPVE